MLALNTLLLANNARWISGKILYLILNFYIVNKGYQNETSYFIFTYEKNL